MPDMIGEGDALAPRNAGSGAGGVASGEATRPRPARTGARPRVKLIAATVALLGVLVAVSPFAQWWFAAVSERAEVVRHVAAVDALDAAERDRVLAEADDYNRSLSSGLIVDPFAGTGAGGEPVGDADAERYLSMLALDRGGVMATVSIPAIDVVLPVYHGSTDQTLLRGAGHIYGSSLPVGGSGTHAVIVGHSGHGESKLFHGLPEVAVDDVFSVTTMGRQMHYRVTSTEVVEPEDVGSMDVVPGRDLVTLVTCTPTGINSHRLLVHAERTGSPVGGSADLAAVTRPFPWWAVAAGGAAVCWGAYVVHVVRAERSRSLG